MSTTEITPDVKVGQMIQGQLVTTISVRAGHIVLSYMNHATTRGVEVTYSPRAIGQLTDLLATAAKVAEGRA